VIKTTKIAMKKARQKSTKTVVMKLPAKRDDQRLSPSNTFSEGYLDIRSGQILDIFISDEKNLKRFF
jgi:hypothetical protein